MTTITPGRIGRPQWFEFMLRSFNYQMVAYSRTWRGSLVSSFLNPVLYLAALGVGLGSFIDDGSGAQALGGQSYLQFLAPAMLAATAMQIATFESTYPVMGGWKWHKTYYAMVASPLRPIDALSGHLLFVAFRLVQTCAVYFVVITVFGAVGSWWGLLAIPSGVLVGLAFAVPTFAMSISTSRDTLFAVYMRFAVLPMFLFSGAFFPVDQLPDLIEPLAYALPLWHGVELCRSFAGGDIGPELALHAGYLVLWAVAGFLLAARQFQRRLVS